MYVTFMTHCQHGMCIFGLSYRQTLAGSPFLLHAGSIPPGIIMLVALEKLDVSANRLTGEF